MINLGYDVVDLHAHLRSQWWPPFQTGEGKEPVEHIMFAVEAGIRALVYMPNTNPTLDCADVIRDYQERASSQTASMVGPIAGRYRVFPTCAMTLGREGKTPVDVESTRELIVGYTDDGNPMGDYDIVEHMFEQEVLVMPHCEPETEMVYKYIEVFARVGKGHLHIQHVSLAETVRVISEAKKSGLKFTAETCPHYCYYDCALESHAVNPPLGDRWDVCAVRDGLANGTIDAIASDFAPLPRPKATGFASFLSFIPLCYGLVLDGTLTAEQLKKKLHDNPLRIIQSGNPALLR